jgi:hypothetical protein
MSMKNAVFWDWCGVGLVRADVSEEHVASTFGVENTRERRKALAVG